MTLSNNDSVIGFEPISSAAPIAGADQTSKMRDHGPIIIGDEPDGGNLDLNGLEALLDRIFSVDEAVPEQNKPIAFRMRRSRTRDHYSHRSDSQLSAAVDLLRAQLDYANEELKALKYHSRWLELKVASRDDQLKHFPQLFEVALETAAVKAQSAEIARENEMLKVKLDEFAEALRRPPFWQTVRAWLFQVSKADAS